MSEFKYNDLGLVTDANETLFGGQIRQIHYGYDQAGFMTSMTYPDGNSITITPNFQGKIASIAQNAQTLVEYDYAGASTVRRTYNQPDVTQDTTYDNLGRITNIHSYHNTTDYVDLDYQYTENDQTIERKYSNTDDKDNWYYYDDLDRLVRNTDGTLDLEVYNIDELGNRDSITIAGVGTIDYDIDDSTNRYDQIDDNDLDYDKAGNLATDHKGYSYEYDYENRIVEITKSGGQTTVAQYAYDALGRRIQKTDSIAGQTTRYYHDNNWRVLTETDENDNQQRSYIYGNGIDEVLVMTDANSNKYYYAQDHLGSTVCLIGENSNIVERYEYTPYGEVTIYTSDGGDDNWFDGDETTSIKSAVGNPYLFTARNLDNLDNGNLKVQYNRNRYYYPEIARWLTKDPLGITPNSETPNVWDIFSQYSDGVNAYEYVTSNPIIFYDPFGLWKVDRNNGLKAVAHAENDTINDLAEKIGLDASEWEKWLTIEDSIKTSKGLISKTELTIDTKICSPQKVEVPNMIIAYWGGWGGGVGKHFVDWGIDIKTLEKRGFYVLESEDRTACDLEFLIESFQDTKKLHGIYAWGHGGTSGFVTKESENGNPMYFSYYEDWDPLYKMGLGVVWACHSGEGGLDMFVSSNGITMGKVGVLIPLPFHLYGPKMKEIIPSGTQGTK